MLLCVAVLDGGGSGGTIAVLHDLSAGLQYCRLDAGDVAWGETRHQYCGIYHYVDGTAADCEDMVARQGIEMDMDDMGGHCGIGVQFGICQQSRAVWILAIPARQYTFIIYKDIARGRNGKYDYYADDSCADSHLGSCCTVVYSAMVDMALIGKGMPNDEREGDIGQKDNRYCSHVVAICCSHHTHKGWGGYWH